MATFSSVQRQHVLAAIAEYDDRGGEQFLEVYGFEPVAGYALVSEGRGYDPRALLAVAHRYATGRLATVDEFHGGMQDAVVILRKRGFEVTEPASARRVEPVRAARPARARTASPAAPRSARARTATADQPPRICPTCFTALPATGICDTCG
ncbi:hypothetical protein OEB99_00995 [Actinotalea sp. M2MS4P-6]|uniref:hypothetical protein n=1 Tax=Actinotalea sp. M2MS4P-6 TaxID=2983762 RepID=UPI0021E3994D|nr:hypothetical protein [Actinotalea sp. M2MS4P-6]MCV2392873.1 hypothetical protein [Actinotalea sp. M2MS4P-6]